MRRAAVAFVVLLALVSFPMARAAVDAPRWSIGDFWDYALDIVVEQGLILNGTLHVEVVSLGVPPLAGANGTAYETRLTGGGDVRNASGAPQFRGRWTFAGEQWVDAMGFKVLKSVSAIDANGTVEPFSLFFSFQVQNTTENAVVSDTWRYPLDVGKTGAYVTNTTSTESVRFRYGGIPNESTRSATYIRTLGLSVTRSSVVRVDAGTFDALTIRVAWPDGEVDLWSYAPAVGNNARTETYNEAGSKVAESSLRSFRYQAGEASTGLLSLPPIAWYGLLLAAVASAVVAVLVRRRRRSRSPAIKAPARREPEPPRGAT